MSGGPRTPRSSPTSSVFRSVLATVNFGPINGGPINLAYARLRHAFLRFATLTRANLEGADLADTDLRDARLEGADLSGADLSDALLERADLAGANLAGANLCGANLVDARNLTKTQLHEAEGDAFTVLPDHLERPLIWTVAQVMETPASLVQPEPRRIEEPREGPPHNAASASPGSSVGRKPWVARRADAPLGDPHNA
jgi:hypothetical protein